MGGLEASPTAWTEEVQHSSVSNVSDPTWGMKETSSNGVLDSTTGKILLGIILSFVIFLSIFGNVLVCVAVYTDRNLRKIGNLFVVSLAIADLFVACVVMTFALVNDLLGYWPFGPKYCDIWIAFDVMCSTASIVNLCAISLDRYIHIKDPLRYGRWMTKRIVTMAIGAIWLLSALVSFLPINLELHRPDPDTDAQEAGEEQCALDLSPAYAVVSSCISFFLPCCVMVGIYSRLYLYAKRHVESIKALVRPVTLGSLEGDTSRPTKVAAPCHVSESKAATTVGIIVGTFLTCWVPFFCVNIAAAFCKTCIPDIVFKVLTWFGYTNSSFNPIIYSIFNQEFQEAFTRILTFRCRPCPSYGDGFNTSSTSYAAPACSPCCSSCVPQKRRPGRSAAGGSGGGSGYLDIPRHHQNGSSTALTEYTVLDAAATPRFSHDRSRASSGERCLILEQISAI
ncbi:dopamine receptor 1-like isoform X1 [Penaeus monodon]|uniref:dopamine receptor 1-like isoform X1 n=1 Tax=Penaeus monodon TaxID=6687 RepID=UPI0018A7372A|nr:dopamine receptor 1-like isoform X1 [Penaeus monodon]